MYVLVTTTGTISKNDRASNNFMPAFYWTISSAMAVFYTLFLLCIPIDLVWFGLVDWTPSYE